MLAVLFIRPRKHGVKEVKHMHVGANVIAITGWQLRISRRRFGKKCSWAMKRCSTPLFFYQTKYAGKLVVQFVFCRVHAKHDIPCHQLRRRRRSRTIRVDLNRENLKIFLGLCRGEVCRMAKVSRICLKWANTGWGRPPQ